MTLESAGKLTATTLMQGALVWHYDDQQWQEQPGWLRPGLDEDAVRNLITESLQRLLTTGDAVLRCFDSSFQPCAAVAEAAGAAIVLPCYRGDQLVAALALVVQRPHDSGAAVEWWTGYRGGSELAIADSVTWGLDRFAAISSYFNLPCGAGLPGKVWQYAAPLAIERLGEANPFMRSSGAASEGLDTGWGVPIIRQHRLLGVVVCLTQAGVQFADALDVFLIQKNDIRLAHHLGGASAIMTSDSRLSSLLTSGLPQVMSDAAGCTVVLPQAVGDRIRSLMALRVLA